MLCDFCPCPENLHLDLLNTMTGFELTLEEYHTIGERIWNVTRLFNVREGFTRKDDTLPARMFDEALNGDERMKIDRDSFDRSLLEYYSLREWDENGVPSDQLLNRLGLDAKEE